MKNTVFLYIFHILGYVKKAQRRCDKDNIEACRISTKIIDFQYKIQEFSASMLEREIGSSWGANLAWFGRPSWGQVAAKLPGSRPKSALVSGLDSEPGSELPFATPVDQIEPGRSSLSLCRSEIDMRI